MMTMMKMYFQVEKELISPLNKCKKPNNIPKLLTQE